MDSILGWDRHFSLLFNAQTVSGANPVGTGTLVPGLEDAQPFSAEVKNMWNYVQLHCSVCLHGMVLN
jgi:hypothetical protein